MQPHVVTPQRAWSITASRQCCRTPWLSSPVQVLHIVVESCLVPELPNHFGAVEVGHDYIGEHEITWDVVPQGRLAFGAFMTYAHFVQGCFEALNKRAAHHPKTFECRLEQIE